MLIDLVGGLGGIVPTTFQAAVLVLLLALAAIGAGALIDEVRRGR